jgi:hypothetical protein
MTAKRATVLHPYLFGLFPILFLSAQNAGEMRFRDLIGPLILVLLATFLAMIVLTRVCRSSDKAGMIVSTLVLLFFTYGYVLHLVAMRTEQLQSSRNDLAVLFGSLVVFLVVLRVLQAMGDRVGLLTSLLNFVAAGLVVVQLGTIGVALWGRQSVHARGEVLEGTVGAATRTPDIFFVLLDGYARQDVLADLYQFDNSAFLGALEERGFEVAEDSRAPYVQTLLSMAAIFNLDYLTGFAPDLDPKSEDRVGLSESIWNGAAIRSLKARGYSTASFATGYTMTEFRGADRYLVPGDNLSEFSRLLISTTPLQVLFDAGSRAKRQRHRIEYVFQRLPELKRADGPLFVLAHIIAPHPPFVFGENADGESGSRWSEMADGSHRAVTEKQRAEYRQRYRQQLAAVNGLATEAIDGLLERPDGQRPVIVLASDHGPGSELRWHSQEETDLRERLASLFAIYLPEGAAGEGLPEPMTPVNTFRMIFNRYQGADYPMLPARSFFSTWEEPFRLTEVEESELRLPAPSSGE